jgi:hypothetical protein
MGGDQRLEPLVDCGASRPGQLSASEETPAKDRRLIRTSKIELQ